MSRIRIEQVDGTIAVPPGQEARMDRFGNVVIDVTGGRT